MGNPAVISYWQREREREREGEGEKEKENGKKAVTARAGQSFLCLTKALGFDNVDTKEALHKKRQLPK